MRGRLRAARAAGRLPGHSRLWRPGSLIDLRDTRSLLQGCSETWIRQACLEALDDGPSSQVHVALFLASSGRCRTAQSSPHASSVFHSSLRVADGSSRRQQLARGRSRPHRHPGGQARLSPEDASLSVEAAVAHRWHGRRLIRYRLYSAPCQQTWWRSNPPLELEEPDTVRSPVTIGVAFAPSRAISVPAKVASGAGVAPTMSRGAPNAALLRAGWVEDTTPCECSADLARHGPRPRRVARPRAECQRPRGALVRPIREECLNRLIPFGERRLRRASMRHRTIANDLHMDYTAVGQTTHLAARMEQLRQPRHDAPHCEHSPTGGRVRRGQAARRDAR